MQSLTLVAAAGRLYPTASLNAGGPEPGTSVSSTSIIRSSMTALARLVITDARSGSHGDGAGAPRSGSVSASEEIARRRHTAG
jgi:hypothetical protein